MSNKADGASDKDGRYSFRRCNCAEGAPPHGYFYDPAGEQASIQYLTVPDATHALGRWLGKQIPTEQKDAIEADIRDSGLPETSPIPAEKLRDEISARDAEVEELFDMIETLLDQDRPEPSEKDGRYSFRRAKPEEEKVAPFGRFHDGRGKELLGYVASLKTANSILGALKEGGAIYGWEISLLEADIAESGLPENEPYLGPFTLMTHKFRVKGHAVAVGYFKGSSERLILRGSEPIISRQEARTFVEKGLKLGQFAEAEQENLFAQIEASDLLEIDEVAPVS